MQRKIGSPLDSRPALLFLCGVQLNQSPIDSLQIEYSFEETGVTVGSLSGGDANFRKIGMGQDSPMEQLLTNWYTSWKQDRGSEGATRSAYGKHKGGETLCFLILCT